MDTITLTLPYPPSANRYWRKYRNVMVKSDEARQYQASAKLLAQAAGVNMMAGELAVEYKVYRPARRGDLDNRLKVIADALQGTCFENDSQIAEIHAYKRISRKNPRVEVKITKAEVGEDE